MVPLFTKHFVSKDGWGPLCKFLEVAEGKCPTAPFPRVNDKQTQLNHAVLIERLGMAISVGLLLLAWVLCHIILGSASKRKEKARQTKKEKARQT
jgi:hypothetical protein